MEVTNQHVSQFFKTKTAADLFSLFSARSFNIFIGLISVLIYGIIFSKSQIAVLNTFEMIVQFVFNLFFSWSSLGIIKFGKTEFHDTQKLNYTSSLRLAIVAPLFILLSIIIFLFRAQLLSYIATTDPGIISFMILYVFMLIVHGHLTSIHTTTENHKQNVYYYCAESLAKLSLLGIFWLNWMSVSAENYLKMHASILFFLAVIRLCFTHKEVFTPFILKVRFQDIRRFLSFVCPQIYGFVGLFLLNWMDVFFIKKHYSLSELGTYQFHYIVFVKLSTFALILNSVFLPKIIEWDNKQPAMLLGYLRRFPKIVFSTLCLAVFAFIFMYPKFFNLVFGQKYVGGYASFNILLMALPLYFTIYLFIPVLNTKDKVATVQGINILSASANLIIDMLFIKKFGIIAAAFGTITCYFIKYYCVIHKVGSLFNMRFIYLILTGGMCYFLSCLYTLWMISH